MPDLAGKLGSQWSERFYAPIKVSLNLDEDRDRKSRDLLWGLLLSRESDIESVKDFVDFENKTAVVFGAGPSLLSDIEGLTTFLKAEGPLIVAADGAADALAKTEFGCDALVSDLDSCSVPTLVKNSNTGTVFAHAHGDNMDLVKSIVPKLGHGTFGTTQVESREPVKNFGGFTDGDRACYIACALGASRMILGGMDFGKVEGAFSVNRYSTMQNPRRNLKLEWGRKSLEYLISQKKAIKFYNVTKFGRKIEGAATIDYERVTSF